MRRAVLVYGQPLFTHFLLLFFQDRAFPRQENIIWCVISKTDVFRIAYECHYFSLDIVFVKKASFKNGTLVVILNLRFRVVIRACAWSHLDIGWGDGFDVVGNYATSSPHHLYRGFGGEARTC